MIILEYKNGAIKKAKEFDINHPPKEVLKVHYVRKKGGKYKLRCSVLAINTFTTK